LDLATGVLLLLQPREPVFNLHEISQHQLIVERTNVTRGFSSLRQHQILKCSNDVNQRIDFAHMLNEFGVEACTGPVGIFSLGTGDVDEAYLGISSFPRLEQLGELVHARVGNLDHADIGLLSLAVTAHFSAEARQRVEDGRLARSRETYESYFHISS